MSGQFLGHLRARPTSHHARHIRVPQAVKIHDAAGVVGGLQEVGPLALGLFLGPPCLFEPRLPVRREVLPPHPGGVVCDVEDALPGLLALEEVPQPVREVLADGLDIAPPSLRVGSLDRDGRRVGVEVEGLGCQALEFAGAKPRAHGRQIQRRPFGTGHPLEGRAFLGRADEPGEPRDLPPDGIDLDQGEGIFPQTHQRRMSVRLRNCAGLCRSRVTQSAYPMSSRGMKARFGWRVVLPGARLVVSASGPAPTPGAARKRRRLILFGPLHAGDTGCRAPVSRGRSRP